jgi:hypothetical protein
MHSPFAAPANRTYGIRISSLNFDQVRPDGRTESTCNTQGVTPASSVVRLLPRPANHGHIRLSAAEVFNLGPARISSTRRCRPIC